MARKKFEKIKKLARLNKLDRKSIDRIKRFNEADDYYKLLIINAQMWIIEEVITDRLSMGNFEEAGRLYKDLRELTNKRAKIKNEIKTY